MGVDVAGAGFAVLAAGAGAGGFGLGTCFSTSLISGLSHDPVM